MRRGSPPQQQLPSDSPPQQELSPDSSLQQQQRISPSYFLQQDGAWGLSPNAAIFIPQTLQGSQQQQYVTPDFYQQQGLYYGWQPQQALYSQQRTSPSSFSQQDEAWGLSSNASSFYSQTLQGSQQQQYVTPGLYQQQEEEYCQDTSQNIPSSLYQSNQEARLLRETSSQRNFMRQRYNVVPQSLQQQQGAWGQPQQYQQSRNPPQQQRVSQNFSQQLQVTGSLPRYRQQQLQISQDPQQLQSTSRRQVPQDLSQHQQQIAWGLPQQQQQSCFSQQQRGTWNQRMRNQSQHQRIPHDSPQQGIWHQSSGSPPQQQLPSDSLPQQELSPDSSLQQQQRTSPSSFPQQDEARGLSPNASIFIPQTLQGSQQQQYVTLGLYQQQEGSYYRRQSQQVLHNSRQRQLSGQHQQVQDLLQQQTTWTPQYQQQQEALTEIDDADKQTQAVEQNNDRGTENNDMQEQVSQLTLQISPKAEMTSFAMKQYQSSISRRQDLCRNESKSQNHTYVLTNMFEIIFHENFITDVVHYDVNITPIASKASYRKVFEKYRLTYFKNRYPAFDGKKNAYSANILPCDDHETDIKIEDKLCHIQCNEQCEEHKIVKTFKITLKKVRDIDLSWMKNLQLDLKDLKDLKNTDKDLKNADKDLEYQTGIQALDIIIHGCESGFTNVGRSLFWDLKNGKLLTKGLCSSWGGFLSAVRGQKMYLNVDVVHKGFVIPQNVTDLIANVVKENSRDEQTVKKIPEKINSSDCMEINKILKGLRVIYEMPLNSSDDPSQKYRRRIYRLKGTGPSADKCTFKYNESEITVTNYFKNEKNYTLKHPKLPCLSVGSKEKEIYLPAELCTIVEGQSVKKLNDEQTTRMIKEAATKPDMRQKRIIEAFENINVNESPIMKQEFHLSVSEQMKIVNAKILDAPKLRYKNEKLASVSDGVWRMQNLELKAGISLEKNTWTILNLTKLNMYSELHKFMKTLIQYARDLGMEIKDAKTDQFKYLNNKNEIQRYFEENKSLKLIIVIIPNCLKSRDFTDIYSEIKQMTELKLGVLTQCIKYQNFTNANSGQSKYRSIITNILLKINAKLNGINYTLHKPPKCLENNFMLVGADVTHPPPDADTPSIAAVTASIDTFGFQYNVMYKLQEPREEMISDLEDIIKSQLETYKIKTKKVPMRLIYYRDGVSEGQLKKVEEIEIRAIKRACAKFSSNIQITCLVVQKRHHVRFFPGEREGKGYKNSDRNGNVKAGTIVDIEITHPDPDPEDFEFYLVSHASIQGTARPTKYRCICNDSNLSKDEIEDMTYYLCHMYARCTRAVSYPAPTYYAHLAAYRGKALIENHNIKITSEETSRAVLSKAQADLDNISIKHSLMYFV
ncbi:unnamed protein product [Lasius platythorax]|uniref:Protein argonaute-2 n=1 Tax=Lasius platythorax TaxID=488582 RepID=A0AAV2NIL3_9HYME